LSGRSSRPLFRSFPESDRGISTLLPGAFSAPSRASPCRGTSPPFWRPGAVTWIPASRSSRCKNGTDTILLHRGPPEATEEQRPFST